MRFLRDDSSQKSFNPPKAEKNTENNNTEYLNIEKNIIEKKHTPNNMTLKTWATKSNRFGVISSQVSFKVSTLKNTEKSTKNFHFEKKHRKQTHIKNYDTENMSNKGNCFGINVLQKSFNYHKVEKNTENFNTKNFNIKKINIQ